MIVMANSLQTHISTWSDPGDVIPRLPPRDFVEDITGRITVRLSMEEYGTIMKGLDPDTVTNVEYAEAVAEYLEEHPPVLLDGARVKRWSVESLSPDWHTVVLTVAEFESREFNGTQPD